MVEAASTEDVYCLDIQPALEAERYLMEHRWRLNREPKLLQRLQALIAREQVYVFLLDARGRPVRQEPSYPLIELMADLAR